MQKIVDHKEFKKLSLNFRRNAGNLLNCDDYDEALRLLKFFLEAINSEPLIADFITKHNTQSFDIQMIIDERQGAFELPLSKTEEISFIYQLLTYASEHAQNYMVLSYGYSSKYSESVRRFNQHVTKRLVNYIGDYLQE